MTSDSTPVFALEKEALKTEIETGLQVGVDHLEDKPMKRKPVEKYHNTRYLLKQYRKVAYAIQISESECQDGDGTWHPAFHTGGQCRACWG